MLRLAVLAALAVMAQAAPNKAATLSLKSLNPLDNHIRFGSAAMNVHCESDLKPSVVGVAVEDGSGPAPTFKANIKASVRVGLKNVAHSCTGVYDSAPCATDDGYGAWIQESNQ